MFRKFCSQQRTLFVFLFYHFPLRIIQFWFPIFFESKFWYSGTLLLIQFEIKLNWCWKNENFLYLISMAPYSQIYEENPGFLSNLSVLWKTWVSLNQRENPGFLKLGFFRDNHFFSLSMKSERKSKWENVVLTDY